MYNKMMSLILYTETNQSLIPANQALAAVLSPKSDCTGTRLFQQTKSLNRSGQNLFQGCPEDRDHLVDMPFLDNERGHQTD